MAEDTEPKVDTDLYKYWQSRPDFPISGPGRLVYGSSFDKPARLPLSCGDLDQRQSRTCTRNERRSHAHHIVVVASNAAISGLYWSLGI